jgi:hypothetical protein
VVERRRAPDFVPTIVVDDRPAAPPSAGQFSTVITLGRAKTRGPVPDLHFVQSSSSTVQVSSADRACDYIRRRGSAAAS